jgi:hypothetical protein
MHDLIGFDGQDVMQDSTSMTRNLRGSMFGPRHNRMLWPDFVFYNDRDAVFPETEYESHFFVVVLGVV